MTDHTDQPEPSDSSQELEELQQRNADLEAQNADLGQQLEQSSRKGGWRMATALVLVVIFGIALFAANPAVWLATTVLETDTFVDTFAPLPDDPAVATAIGTEVASVVSEQVALAEVVADLLPEELQFIAVPIAGAVEGVIAEASTAIISSDVFTTIWENTLRIAHSATIAVLEGSQSGSVQVQDGAVVLDLTELVSRVDEQLTERGIDVIDTETIDGTIVLFERDALGVVENVLRLVYEARWLSPLVALLLLIGALAVATDRRRATIWLGVTTIIVMVLSLLVIRYARNSFIEGIADPVYRDGASAAWSIVFDRLLAQTWGLLALGLVATLAAWFFGPSTRSASLRDSFIEARNASHADEEPSSTTMFFMKHRRTLEFVAVGVGAIFLLLVPTLRGWIVIVTALIVIGVVAAIEWIGGAPDRGTATESEPESAEPKVDA